MHGGLSPELKSLEQIKRIPRPTDVPDTGLLCDLLWADPDKEINGWGENDRGVSYTFGQDSVTEFLAKHDLDLVCRAHQVHKTELMPCYSTCYRRFASKPKNGHAFKVRCPSLCNINRSGGVCNCRIYILFWRAVGS